jgi:hypothetical protein
MSRNRRLRVRVVLLSIVTVLCVSWTGGARPSAQATAPAPDLKAERALAATVSETRMVETVRKLVGFGTRMYGTPSNHEAAAWLATAFKEAGLEVTVRKDTGGIVGGPHRRRGCRGSEDHVAKFGVAVRQGRRRPVDRRGAGRRLSRRQEPHARDHGRVRRRPLRRAGVGVGVARRWPSARHVDDSRVCRFAQGVRAAA